MKMKEMQVKVESGMKAPAYLEKYNATADNSALAGGVVRAGGITTFLPSLSIRGRDFYLRHGRERVLLDARKLDVIIIAARPTISKKFYSQAWGTGAEARAPDCFSIDGLHPDPESVNKQAKSCKECDNNVFGSARLGKGKACSDYKRLVVWILGSEEVSFPCVLDVPSTSLWTPKDLKGEEMMLNDYVAELIANNLPYNAVVTRISFASAEYPKLKFEYARSATEEEFVLAREMADTPGVAEALGVAGPQKEASQVKAEQPVEQKETHGEIPVDEALGNLRDMLKGMR